MDYIEVKFICIPNDDIVNSVLSACIAELGFESFVESEGGTTAYIQADLFDTKAIDKVIADFPVEADLSYTYERIVGRDWNEEWEKNYFEPLNIDNKCIIQSTFHNIAIPKECEYNIFIDPKMAFGTGHHQTTELMIREILKADFRNKTVLDMGCGTAILAILASMRGAKKCLGIDIDQWAYDNAVENLHLNKVDNVEIEIGGAELLGKESFDVILANINRNILLNDIKHYAAVLNTGGSLYMSGFYVEDVPVLKEECAKYRLSFAYNVEKDNWAAAKFVK